MNSWTKRISAETGREQRASGINRKAGNWLQQERIVKHERFRGALRTVLNWCSKVAQLLNSMAGVQLQGSCPFQLRLHCTCSVYTYLVLEPKHLSGQM